MAGAIEWHSGDLSAAQALANTAGRPLFLYWGAGWCPPCNRVKSEIFSRDEFAARLRGLVPFWLDGDAPGAQALAAQLKLRSYPTLVLFAPDGSEITRLPCELDGELFLDALDTALAASHTAAQSLQAALDGSRVLSGAEWKLLSHYSWDTDEGVLLAGREPGPLLAALAQAAASSAPDAAIRLRLLSLLFPANTGIAAAPGGAAAIVVGAGSAGGAPAAVGFAGAAEIAAAATTDAFLLGVCRDARLARANMDLFGNNGAQLLKLAGAAQPELASALAQVAQAWADDMWLSVPDRLTAVRLQMRMARFGHAATGLPDLVRASVAAALAEVDDPYERHTLVNTAVSALNDAGLSAEAEALLQAELARSHSPYYFMLSLAASAKRRGDMAGMLSWYEQAWRAAVGSATRLQWGVTYLSAVLDNAPGDSARIEAAAAAILDDVNATADVFSQRNLAQVHRLAVKLSGTPHAPALQQALRPAL
ncbi:thioredoxin family protein [Massilia sp. BJB1822]|uniref:thioredoxin family protein n=1 Tax=Massilia sp. BJB1822 TaxID=2744470 RepID=UPI0015949D6C|nr:thioredoxin family protein [Massilia sp. BJB1822]NVD96446.1 thioredoxin family protein [Massilia sp. BJB1822]